jgi:hypothetical protein
MASRPTVEALQRCAAGRLLAQRAGCLAFSSYLLGCCCRVISHMLGDWLVVLAVLLLLPWVLRAPCIVLEHAIYSVDMVAACQRLRCASACGTPPSSLLWGAAQLLAMLAVCYTAEWGKRQHFAREVCGA